MAYGDAATDEKYSLSAAYGGPPKKGASEEDMGCYVLARYSIQNDHYAGLYEQWIKPIFFIVGKHWVKWNQREYTYNTDTDVPPWRQQPVTNWTFAVYRTLLAKCTKQKPTQEVVPPSGDSEDREAAQLGEAILEFLWRHLKSPRKVVRALGWLFATGNVAINVDWDSDEGEARPRTSLVEVPHPQMPGETMDVDCPCDENGEPLRRDPLNDDDLALDGGKPYDLDAEPEMEPTGEISIQIEDPLSYRWNPEATSEDDATEFFSAKFMKRSAAALEFECKEDEFETGGGEIGEQRAMIDEMLASVTAGSPDPFNAKFSATSSSATDDRRDEVLVIKYYRKPSRREGFPKGRHWIVAGGKKVWPKEGETELPHGFWPPRVTLTDCPIPGQPQGLGVLSQVVPLNEKYNFLDGKIGEYHTMSAMGGVIWVHPDDAKIRITSEPGQVKVSRGMIHGMPPVREKLEALPAAVYEERALLVQNIQTISGISQLDMGQRPEGVTAGRAFLVIQEASDAAISPTITVLENAIAEMGRRELVLAQNNYDEPRTIKIRGEKGQWEFRSFKGADLRDGLDVRVQEGSMFPWSKSAQWDLKLSLLESPLGAQLCTNPTTGQLDPSKLAKYLEPSGMGLASFETGEDPDLVEIEREHAMFEAYDPADPTRSNELPQLAVWQDQAKHQQYHFEFMKRSIGRFNRWSKPAQFQFFEHMRLTTEAVAETVAALTGSGDPSATGDTPGATAPTPAEQTGPAPTTGARLGGKGRVPTSPRDLQLTKGDRASAQSAA